MITWQTLKKSIDNKQFGKGVCTSDDEKPVENIANGSELIEIDTGKRCVFDLGREEWIEYGTGEDRGGGGGVKITTETISGPLSTIFSDNEWNEAKFRQLEEDIRAGQASARLTVTMGVNYFDAQLMVAGSTSSAETMALATAFFAFTLNDFVVRIVWSFEGEAGIGGVMMAYNPSAKAWDIIDDSTLAQMIGQSSYDLVITRIKEE